MSRPSHRLAVPRAGAVPPGGGSRVALRGRAGLRGGGAGCRAGPGLRAAAAVPPHRAGRRWVVPPGRLLGPSWSALLHRSSGLQPCGCPGALWLVVPSCSPVGQPGRPWPTWPWSKKQAVVSSNVRTCWLTAGTAGCCQECDCVTSPSIRWLGVGLACTGAVGAWWVVGAGCLAAASK